MKSLRTLLHVTLIVAAAVCLMAAPAFASISFYDGTFNLSNYGSAQI